MADLDPALVEKAALAICANDEDNQECDPPLICTYSCVACRNMARPAILSLGIPAAALNALVRGEAKIWPVEPTREMWAAGANVVVDRRRLHHDTVIKRVITAMDAASPYAAKE